MTQPDQGSVPSSTVAAIAMASALMPLNSTMLAVALPHIARSFDITKSHTSILITVYLAAMLLGQPIAGRVADAVGARRLAVISVSGFGAFSAAAIVAPTFAALVVLRAAQAAFAAGLSPSVQAILRQIVPPEDRGRAFGVQGSVIGIGAGLGPVIGGLVTAVLGWRAIFAVNLPVVVAVLLVLRRELPAPRESADLPASSDASAHRLLNGRFTVAFATQALSTFAQYALLLAVPIVLDSRGWSAATIGLGVSALTIGMVLLGPFGGRQGDRYGRRRPVVIGLGVNVAAVGVAAALGDSISSLTLIGCLLVFGLGLGAAAPSILTAGIEAAPQQRVGAAAGLLSASRYLGSIASTLVLADVVHDNGTGLAVMLAVCAASLVASLTLACWLPGRP